MFASVLSTPLSVLSLRWYSKIIDKLDQWLFHSVSGKNYVSNSYECRAIYFLCVSSYRSGFYKRVIANKPENYLLKLLSLNMQDNISSFKYGINFDFYQSFIWGIWSQIFHHENNSWLISNANQLTDCHAWEHWL